MPRSSMGLFSSSSRGGDGGVHRSSHRSSSNRTSTSNSNNLKKKKDNHELLVAAAAANAEAAIISIDVKEKEEREEDNPTSMSSSSSRRHTHRRTSSLPSKSRTRSKSSKLRNSSRRDSSNHHHGDGDKRRQRRATSPVPASRSSRKSESHQRRSHSLSASHKSHRHSSHRHRHRSSQRTSHRHDSHSRRSSGGHHRDERDHRHHRRSSGGSGSKREEDNKRRSSGGGMSSSKRESHHHKKRESARSSSKRYSSSTTSNSNKRASGKAKSRTSKRFSFRVSAEDFMCATNEVFKDKYILGDVLYEGEFCRIHQCTHKLTGCERVVKVVYELLDNGTGSDDDDMDDTTERMAPDFSLRDHHHNDPPVECPEFEVMRHLDTSFTPKVFKMYDQDGYHMIVMERCYGNNLEKKLEELSAGDDDDGNGARRRSPLSEATVKLIMWQIFSCLNYLHDSANVVHCDLRPCNILLDHPNDFSKIKIIDFDEAIVVEDSKEKIHGEKRGLGKGLECVYTAPEIHDKRPRFNSKADMWTCGVLMYYLLYKRYPFVSSSEYPQPQNDQTTPKETVREIIRRMNKSKLKFPKLEVVECTTTTKEESEPSADDGSETEEAAAKEETAADISKDAKDLIASLLHPNYKRRPNAAKALTHKWFAKEYGTDQTAKDAYERTLDDVVEEDHMTKIQRMTRLSNLRKHNPNSRLKQAVCSIIAAELLTKDEHAKVDSVFQQLDILNDGRLRKCEVKAAFLLSMGATLTDEDVEDIFQRCDSNRNGSLDFSEFAVASMDEKDLMSEERLHHVFRRFDRDNDGAISKTELQNIPAFANYTNDELDFIIAEVDMKGNGEIDYENFVQLMKAGTLY